MAIFGLPLPLFFLLFFFSGSALDHLINYNEVIVRGKRPKAHIQKSLAMHSMRLRNMPDFTTSKFSPWESRRFCQYDGVKCMSDNNSVMLQLRGFKKTYWLTMACNRTKL